MATKHQYINEVERLFSGVYDVFTRVRKGEVGIELTGCADAILNNLDGHGHELLKRLYEEVESHVLAQQEKERRTASKRIFNRLRKAGIVFGPRYAELDRAARIGIRNFRREYDKGRELATVTDAVDWIEYGMMDVRVKEISDWLYHFAVTASGWWNPLRCGGTLLGEYYTPIAGPESVRRFLVDDTPEDIIERLVKELHPGRDRDQFEWEARAVVIYESRYFKMVHDGKRWTFKAWAKEFCRMMNIPFFTQRGAQEKVYDEAVRLSSNDMSFLSA